MTITGKSYIFFTLKELKIPFVQEHKFLNERKFRFDFAILSPTKIAIEYEGIFSAKARHTTATGYTGDTTKYNLAVIDGWRVLRYTAMNYKEFYGDIKMLIK